MKIPETFTTKRPVTRSLKRSLRTLLSLCLMVCMLPHSIGSTTAMTTESQQLLDDMVNHVEQTMHVVSAIESKAGNDISDMHVLLSIPARMSATVGMVLDLNDANGYRVLSTTPQGFASSVGINTNDTLVAINGLSTRSDNRREAFAALEDATAGDTLQFDVEREDSVFKAQGQLKGVYTPHIKIELGTDNNETQSSTAQTAASDDSAQQDSDACGQVSTFFRPPKTRDLYSVFVSQINDDNVIRSRTTFKLAPGKHKIDVHELIDFDRFTRRSNAIQRAKPIIIDVKKDTVYYLAARFIPENRKKERTGEYWEPVIWKTTEDRACSL